MAFGKPSAQQHKEERVMKKAANRIRLGLIRLACTVHPLNVLPGVLLLAIVLPLILSKGQQQSASVMPAAAINPPERMGAELRASKAFEIQSTTASDKTPEGKVPLGAARGEPGRSGSARPVSTNGGTERNPDR